MLIFCLRSVRMSELSHSFNQCVKKLYPITLTSNADEHADCTYISAKGFCNTLFMS